MRQVRGGEPTFDLIMIVELRRGRFDGWQVVTDAAAAVDAILEGRENDVQLRTRDPSTGHMHLELGRSCPSGRAALNFNRRIIGWRGLGLSCQDVRAGPCQRRCDKL
eukprot:749681-Rhodomonas_salina.3